MISGLILDNLLTYCLQIGMLVGLAAFVPALLRLRQPGAKLIYWQILLAVCLLLPLQPWRQQISVSSLAIVSSARVSAGVPTKIDAVSAPFAISPGQIVLILLLSGIAVRLAFLAGGLWKLRGYRRRSTPLEPAPTWSVEAAVLLSHEVTSPVTFGWRNPAVLLPANFLRLSTAVQEAILCHEILHVRRGDWLFTFCEEVVRAVFWFHPAIWWLLGEIGLAREQEVDRLAIEITQQREEYMDALVAIASARSQLDLAPAPLFLRKRHLKHRVVLIVKEHRMSKKRVISALATSLAVLAGMCWLIVGSMPLVAQPQVVYDAAGVTVNTNGAPLMHRTAVNYPASALQKNIQGALSVEVKLDASGNVSDARVLSGPEELRRSALEAVLQWHFSREVANTSRVVTINFEVPKAVPAQEVVTVAPGMRESVTVTAPPAAARQAVPGVLGGVLGSVPSNQVVISRTPMDLNGPVRSIVIQGLPDRERDELAARLPVHEGDILTPELLQRATEAAQQTDEHLSVRRAFTMGTDGQPVVSLIITTPTAARPQAAAMPQRIKVGGNVQAAMIVRKVQPIYPSIAMSARVQGVVHLAAVVGPDGNVQELHAVGGPPLLIQAAMDAVKQWGYKPTMLNGVPVAVETTIDVNFTLNDQQ